MARQYIISSLGNLTIFISIALVIFLWKLGDMCSTLFSSLLSILDCDHTLGRANLAQRLHFPDGTLGLREEDFYMKLTGLCG